MLSLHPGYGELDVVIASGTQLRSCAVPRLVTGQLSRRSLLDLGRLTQVAWVPHVLFPKR